jgi:Ca2+-binding EF-hand superfamily protein
MALERQLGFFPASNTTQQPNNDIRRNYVRFRTHSELNQSCLMKIRIRNVTILCLVTLCGCAADRFKEVDRDKSGVLSKSEVGLALLDSVFAFSDGDGDARITFAEWKAANPEAKQELFAKRDEDKDGAVTPEELKAYANRVGSFDKLFATIDTSGDTQIDRTEARAFREKLEAAAAAAETAKKQNP